LATVLLAGENQDDMELSAGLLAGDFT